MLFTTHILAYQAEICYNILMQFKVPQDVLRPDKIVGFLTLRQLIICLIGGSVDYMLYMILNKQYYVQIWLIPIVFVGLVTAAFAFIRFHEMNFEKLLFVFIQHKFLPRARTWQKMNGDAARSVFDNTGIGIVQKKEEKEPLTDRKKKLEEITRLVDTHGKEMLSKTPSQSQNTNSPNSPPSSTSYKLPPTCLPDSQAN